MCVRVSAQRQNWPNERGADSDLLWPPPSPSSRSGSRATERRGGEGCQKDNELNEARVKIPVTCSLLSGFLSPFDQGWERERRGRQLGADPGSAGRKET